MSRPNTAPTIVPACKPQSDESVIIQNKLAAHDQRMKELLDVIIFLAANQGIRPTGDGMFATKIQAIKKLFGEN